MNTIRLHNDVQMPQIGLGTWQITGREILAALLDRAWQTGYRLIDTAAAYSNEMAVGKALAALAPPRDELFLSGKGWNTCRGFGPTQEACRRSLKKLKSDYFDLYLIHWPASPRLHSDWRELNADTWRGMEALYREGLVRAIGVCNFKEHHLEELAKTAEILPMVNQVECHPGLPQTALLDYCRKVGIAVEASSPLGNGQILQNETLRSIAQVHEATPAQICLCWALGKGLVVIPKTANPDRLTKNFSACEIALTAEEVQAIDSIPYCGGLNIDADEVTEFG